MIFNLDGGRIVLDLEKGIISSISYKGVDICAKKSPIFVLRLTEKSGSVLDLASTQAKEFFVDGKLSEATFSKFSEDISVKVKFLQTERGINVRFSVENRTDKIVEHVEIMPIVLKPLVKNGGIGKILYPYNEGALIEDNDLRATCHLQYNEPQYPSMGSYGIFPNMIQSQFMAYLFGGGAFSPRPRLALAY